MKRPAVETAHAGDRQLLRRAARAIAGLTALAVAIVVAGVLGLTLFLTVREQKADAVRLVRDAALSAEDVDDPPPGVTLILRRASGAIEVSPSAPDDLQSVDPETLPAGSSVLTLGDDRGYEVYTDDRNGVRITAALDLDYRNRESERLLRALIPAGLLGIAAAALLGWLVARRAVRPLGDALALQRRFVADASHELRTPLAILNTRAQLLRRRAAEDEPNRADLDRLIDDSRAMAEIVNDLLISADMARRPAERVRTDLAEIARVVTDSFAAIADPAGITLTAVATDGPADVLGSPVALRRAAAALVDNALGHTPRGGTVTVTTRHRGSHVELEVADDGEGLDPDDAARLTQRFARGTDAPSEGRRFGLGLALVNDVVHAHGGSFRLDGRPGLGATATITLPSAS